MTRVLKASKRFQAIEADLRSQAQRAQEQVAPKRNLLQQLRSQEQDPDADARQRERTAKQVRQLQAEIEDQSTAASRALADKTGDACAKMYRQIEDAANRVAKREGIELVMFYTDAVTEADFYHPNNVQRKMTQPGALVPMIVAPGMDVTERVLEALEKIADR
jgi:Skp family chaperone for outer membrane proteins